MSLQIDSRTGIYQYRKIIPQALRPYFGKSEYKTTLETRDLGEAKIRMLKPAAAYEREAELARSLLLGGPEARADAMVKHWLGDNEHDERWLRGIAVRLAGFIKAALKMGAPTAAPAWVFMPEIKEDPSETELRRLAAAATANVPTLLRLRLIGKQMPGFFVWVLQQIGEHSKVPVEPGSELAIAVAQRFQRELIDAVASYRHLARGETGSQGPIILIDGGLSSDEGRATALSPTTSVDGWPVRDVGLTITKALEAWRDNKRGKPRPRQRVQEWDLAVRRFIKMYGDIDMGLIRPQMVRDYRDKLLEIPSRAKDKVKVLSFDEQAAIAEREQLDTLAPGTVNKHLTALRSITEFVIDKMSNIPLELNAAARAKFVETEDDETKRLPFDEEDLEAIFRNLVITDTTGISSESIFWIVLLAPLTGGRLEELGTLRPSNVRSESGIPFVAIERDRAQARAKQGAPEKTLKTSNSDRDIPLHPILLQAGFLEYVDRRRAEGAEWLFPDLKANAYGKRTYRVSRLFARYLEELGITDDEKVFHSFRHSVRRNLRGRAPEEIVDLLCGHSDGKVGRRYGRGADMRPLREVIELIDLGGPDWDRVVAQGREYNGLPAEPVAARTPKQLGLI